MICRNLSRVFFSFGMGKKNEMWKQVMGYLENRFPREEIETWFSNTSLRNIDPSLVTIEVTNKFVAHWLKEKYTAELQKGFGTFFSSPPEIQYILPPSIREKSLLNGKTPFVPSNTITLPRLNENLTFQNFVTGETNRFAFQSAFEAAKGPARLYNPLFIWGASGAGKTHLLHAIGNYVRMHRLPDKAQYISANHFTELVSSGRKRRTMDQLRNEIGGASLLLFDDVDLLSGRSKSQNELNSFFNLFHATNRQIVFTAKLPPNQIPGLNKKMASRLQWGLISGIEAPDQETKVKIIGKKSGEEGIDIPDDAAFFLASHTDNLKDLMHLVTRLHTYASVHRKPVDISLVKLVLSGNHALSSAPTIKKIQEITARFFDLPLSELLSKSKKRRCSYPRQIAMYLCRLYTERSYKEIGMAFENKDHSTVIYAVRHITKLMEENDRIRNEVLNIENLIG